jgi:hypothetical protein
MTREEVFRGSGPTSGATVEVKIGAKKDGSIVAAQQVLKFQAGAFPGSPVQPGCMCGFALHGLPNVDVVGCDVVSNRPKVAAYRAPGAPITSFAVESLLDDLAHKLQGPADVAGEECGAEPLENPLRPEPSKHRVRNCPDNGQEPSALEVFGEARSWPRFCLWLLVQRRRRVDGSGSH